VAGKRPWRSDPDAKGRNRFRDVALCPGRKLKNYGGWFPYMDRVALKSCVRLSEFQDSLIIRLRQLGHLEDYPYSDSSIRWRYWHEQSEVHVQEPSEENETENNQGTNSNIYSEIKVPKVPLLQHKAISVFDDTRGR
jgi:hypothetical protein